MINELKVSWHQQHMNVDQILGWSCHILLSCSLPNVSSLRISEVSCNDLFIFLTCIGLLVIVDFLILWKFIIYNKGFYSFFIFTRLETYMDTLMSFKSWANSVNVPTFLVSIVFDTIMDSFTLKMSWAPTEGLSMSFTVIGFLISMNFALCSEGRTKSKHFSTLLIVIEFLTYKNSLIDS